MKLSIQSFFKQVLEKLDVLFYMKLVEVLAVWTKVKFLLNHIVLIVFVIIFSIIVSIIIGYLLIGVYVRGFILGLLFSII